MKQEKRHKFQLYYEILCAIAENTNDTNAARPTRVQYTSRLSYDKMMNHFNELEKMGMICRLNGGLISITSKGMEFTKQYNKLTKIIKSVGL